MKYTLTTSRLAAVLGLTTLFAVFAAAAPAHAQDNYRVHQNRETIRYDVSDLHRDQDRLHDLYRRRDYLRGRRDWRGVAELDVQIGGLSLHLDNDRYDTRRDFDRARFDRDRDYRHDFNADRDHYRPLDHDVRRDRYQDDYRVRDGH